jgi:hypothetical protein
MQNRNFPSTLAVPMPCFAATLLAQNSVPYALAQETVLYSFTDSTDGGFPFSGVILDKQGNLYGTTTEGGNLLTRCVGDNLCRSACGWRIVTGGRSYR